MLTGGGRYRRGVHVNPTPARRLAAAIEPIAGQAQFSPEAQAAYERLGFAASPGRVGSTVIPDRSAYLCARSAVLGDVPGTVVAAAFGVFDPDAVVPLVTEGRARADAATLWACREAGAVAQLRRVLGEPDPQAVRTVTDELLAAAAVLPVAGRALAAGQRALPVPDEPLARLWRATDQLREHRGDAHIIAWTAEGLDGVEVGLLGDLYWGLPPRSHTAGRGWSTERLESAEARLVARGLLVDGGGGLTEDGFALRDHIELRTDALLDPALDRLAPVLDDIVATLAPWSASLVAAGAYLSPPVRFTF